MTMQEIFDQPQKIPTLPAVFYKLNEYQGDPDKTLKDYGSLVEMDPGLAQKVLALVNSSYYGFSWKIDRLSHAVGIIGVDQLINLILSVVLVERFSGIPEDYVTMQSFWAHSLGCAIAARRISETVLPKRKNQLYLAGLLHDLGSLLLYSIVPEKAKVALEHCNQMGMRLVDAENMALGYNHAELGGRLMEQWGLPEMYSEMIHCHHNPQAAPEFGTETRILYLADHLVMSAQLGSAGEWQADDLDPAILESLGLKESALPEILEFTLQHFNGIFEILCR